MSSPTEPAAAMLVRSCSAVAASVVVGDGPVTHRRFDSRRRSAASSSVTSIQPRSADHPLDGAIGSSLRRRSDRRHVEHLATADGLVAARLAKHVPIAGQQRQVDRKVERAPCPRVPGDSASEPITRTFTGTSRDPM